MYRLINFIKKNKIKSVVLLALLLTYLLCLPKQLFKNPTATVITSNTNVLLGAQIAKDGQWRSGKR